MRTARWPLAVRVALVVAATLVLARAVAAETPRAERPTYKVGERWIRNDGAYRLDRIENGYYVFVDERIPGQASTQHEEWITVDSLGIGMVRHGERFLRLTPPPRLEWPLEVGRSGATQTHMETQKTPPGGVAATLSWSVAALEEISVSGQMLDAFRIEWAIHLEAPYRFGGNRALGGGAPGIGWSMHYRQWYAPSVRQIVRSVSDRMGLFNFAVVAFDRLAESPLTITLEGLTDGTRVTSEMLTLRGRVAGSGIARVSITVNGTEMWAATTAARARSDVALSVPLTLRDGRNVVLVTATDAGGHTRQERRRVTLERPAASAPAAAVVAPPRVVLMSPRDQARVEQPSITLAGVANGPRGVSRVVVTVNGVEAARLGDGTSKPALALTVPLALREGVNTIVVTASDPAGRMQQEARTVSYDKVVPLSVAFRYPDNGAHVSEQPSVVAAVASSSRGVAVVTVSLNGVEVARQRPSTPQKSVVVAVPVTLKPGANAVVVTAAQPDGTHREDVRTVVYDPPKLAAAGERPAEAAAPPRRPLTTQQWAVVVGVGKYDNRSVPTLRYSVADARAMYDTLRHTGVPADHIVLLTDDSDKKPTLHNVKWALGTFLGRSATKDDTVIIYYAGHGAPEIDPRGLERDGLAKYLIPSDADPDDLYSTALPMDELQTIFARIEADRVVAFLDACYSGAAGGRTFVSKRTRAGSVDDLFLERLTRSKGRAIVTASRPSEVSIELPEFGHGLFTYYLVEGLKGAADLNHDGIVTLQELYEYVEQQVSAKSRAVGGNQHPVMKGELEGVLPLAKVR